MYSNRNIYVEQSDLIIQLCIFDSMHNREHTWLVQYSMYVYIGWRQLL